jgi:hypothetical protein
MPNFNNLFNNQSLTSRFLASVNKSPVVASSNTVVNPQLDATWGGNLGDFQGPDPNPYFTYFFSGQDISVSIDGTQANINFQTLPVLSLGFQVTQPKLQIYGFWNYTYSAIAYGARQIAARLEIATSYPNYMTNLLREVAKERLDSTNAAYVNSAPLSTDDANVVQFWGGGAGTSQTGSQINIYQQHPPFDMIVIYGIQETSIGPNGQQITVDSSGNIALNDLGNNALYLDTNERLVENTTGPSHRLILQSCEIINMSTQFTTSGELISETYDLIVNDISLPTI